MIDKLVYLVVSRIKYSLLLDNSLFHLEKIFWINLNNGKVFQL
mgnify:CR=1 FL=1